MPSQAIEKVAEVFGLPSTVVHCAVRMWWPLFLPPHLPFVSLFLLTTKTKSLLFSNHDEIDYHPYRFHDPCGRGRPRSGMYSARDESFLCFAWILKKASRCCLLPSQTLRGPQRELQDQRFCVPFDVDSFYPGPEGSWCGVLLSFIDIFGNQAKPFYRHCCGNDLEEPDTSGDDAPDCCLCNLLPADGGNVQFLFRPITGNGECPGVWGPSFSLAKDAAPGQLQDELP